MNTARPSIQTSRRKAWYIVAFCGVYVSVQLFLIVRGHFVSSKHFAFWMFPESTYFRATLTRVLIDGEEVKTKKGAWTVETDTGEMRYRWQSFVQGYKLDRLETRQRAKGTFDDTLKYYRAALNYVAGRIPEDKSTYQLILRIDYQRAGGPEESIVLESTPRLGGRRHATS